MGLLIKKEIDENTLLAIWSMQESLEALQKMIPQEKKSHFNNLKRNKEWFATRVLLKEISPKSKITYTKYGSPRISDSKYISISHTKKLIAIIIGKNKTAIDIEEISNKTLSIFSKFSLKNNHPNLTKESATLIWCAKECVVKIHEKGGINLKRDILIKPFSALKEGVLYAAFNDVNYKLNYEKINNHYLVYFCS